MYDAAWGQTDIEVVTAPSGDVVTLDEVKDHLQVSHTDEDKYLAALLESATDEVQRETRYQLLSGTYRLHLRNFPPAIVLNRVPITAVTSIIYVDAAGDSQTLNAANYQYNLSSTPVSISPAWGKSWPTARIQESSVKVLFVAGYATRGAVPESLKSAIKLTVDYYYQGCDKALQARDRLLMTYRWGAV
jgi:uncharacterized phiE125 gp8 family phage protein